MIKKIADRYISTDYTFERTTVRYVVMKDTKAVFMLLIPRGMEENINTRYETFKENYMGYPNNYDWFAGSLVHLHLSHHCTPMYDNSYKLSESTKKLKFESQSYEKTSHSQTISTVVSADEGYSVIHKLIHYNNENGFEINCTFLNKTGKSVVLEMITSASLDCLSPFMYDDGSESLVYHTFRGGWATEGKHIESTLPQLNMEKSWGGSFECEKIGSIGSKTVGRYYPYAALEDRKHGCTWGIKPKQNTTWQIELSRYGTPLSLSTGIGDFKFGHWCKTIENGGSFTASSAYIAVVKGGIDEVSNDLIEMNNRDIDAYGEAGMPIIFNDWVTNWGNTSHDKLISLAKVLKDTKVKYFVVDDGWQTGGVGDWKVDKQKFPQGLKAYTDEIRGMGMIPGIWMEFEAVREGSERYSDEYNSLYLTKYGKPIVNAVCNSVPTKFLDFRKPEVKEFLVERVIQFLKENGFGYLKVDYNANIGIGCDDTDSLGEGLRRHMDEVLVFFKKIKEEIPDIIIENCASGGSRLEPSMMGVTAMSSFSDAHECIEVPIVAANMHYLISPRQSQIWCVLKEDFDERHMRYVIASGFLGRLCWSGYIDNLFDWQIDMLHTAEKFYEKVSDIIKEGRSSVHRTNFINNRNPHGTQAVVRYSKDMNRILVVCHLFNNAKEIEVELNDNYEIEDTLYSRNFLLKGSKLIINGNDIDANVLLLKRA